MVNPERTRQADGALAYDWGVERFLSGVTHTGELENIDNPRWWQQEKEQTIRVQQAVSLVICQIEIAVLHKFFYITNRRLSSSQRQFDQSRRFLRRKRTAHTQRANDLLPH